MWSVEWRGKLISMIPLKILPRRIINSVIIFVSQKVGSSFSISPIFLDPTPDEMRRIVKNLARNSWISFSSSMNKHILYLVFPNKPELFWKEFKYFIRLFLKIPQNLCSLCIFRITSAFLYQFISLCAKGACRHCYNIFPFCSVSSPLFRWLLSFL